jgi:hypothetical protein
MMHQQKHFPGTIDPESQIFNRYPKTAVRHYPAEDPQQIIHKSYVNAYKESVGKKNIFIHHGRTFPT